jgi:hypothetical protein
VWWMSIFAAKGRAGSGFAVSMSRTFSIAATKAASFSGAMHQHFCRQGLRSFF